MKNNKIGVYLGGFHPMHRGHLHCIMAAKTNCEHVYVVVCGYDNDERAATFGFSLLERYNLIKNFFEDDPYITVIMVNDTELGLDQSWSNDNWKKWTDYTENLIKQHNPNIDLNSLVYYTAEKQYVDSLTANNKKTMLMNRRLIPISGTMIRENPWKYWNYIIQPFKLHLTKRILIIGTASEGKTSLCQSISEYFGIPWVKEYGRTYMKHFGITNDEDLTFGDFVQFISTQNDHIDAAVKQASNEKGVMIADTDNLVTLMYAKAYSEMEQMKITSEEYAKLEEYVASTIDQYQWDYIFILSPNNTFVDDGSRYMKQSSMEERQKNYNILRGLVRKYYKNCRLRFLEGGDFQYNLMSVVDTINQFEI